MAILLTISILLTAYINYGFAKDLGDHIIDVRDHYPQKSYYQAQAIEEINRNLQGDELVILLLSEQTKRDKEDWHFATYFRSDNVQILGDNINFEITYPSYVYSELSAEDTINILQKQGISKTKQIAQFGRENGREKMIFAHQIEIDS